MSKTGKIIYFLISVVFFVLFDFILSNETIRSLTFLPANPVLDLVYVKNTGAAFSILQDARVFLICFSALAILFISFYTIKQIEKISGMALFWVSLLVAGIFCNMYERITLGFVRDFFKLNFVNFPVFNISDIFINVSVFAIVIIIIKHNFKKNNETCSR